MGILRKLFWLALFLVATFSFVVVFEHGFKDFPKNAQVEFENLKKFTGAGVARKKDLSDQIAE